MTGWPGSWALCPAILGASPRNSRKEMQLSASVDSWKPKYAFLSKALYHSFIHHILIEHLLCCRHWRCNTEGKKWHLSSWIIQSNMRDRH